MAEKFWLSIAPKLTPTWAITNESSPICTINPLIRIESFTPLPANKLKNKVEDTVIDGVKQVIVEHGPEAVKYVTKKIDKKWEN